MDDSPSIRRKRDQNINQVLIDNTKDWKKSHYQKLKHSYFNAPFKDEMLKLVQNVLANEYKTIAELSTASTKALCEYFSDISVSTRIYNSSSLGITGKSTQRLIDICLELNGLSYLTGHGARNYLEHEKFEKDGIGIFYMDYSLKPYPQLVSDFNPYLSALDLIANCGKGGIDYINGDTLPWKEFIND